MKTSANNEISKLLGSIHDRDHYTVLRDFFELSAISIRNAVDFGRDRDTYEMRYKAIAEKYRKEYLEIIARAFAMLGAQILKAAHGDIDSRCVHMTYVTLSLLGVPAVVRLGDALMMKYHEAWFTPAYLMAWPHFKAQIGRGKYPNSATVPKSSEPQENAPEPPKQETLELATAVAETAPNCDENGQFSLF